MTSTDTSTFDDLAGLRVQRRPDGLCVLTLDRPATHNAITDELFTALIRQLDTIATDPTVHAVVLTGANGTFSAGGDFATIAQLGNAAEPVVAANLSRTMRASALLWALPQPTIAAIDGPAVGGGLGFALACDIRLASPTAMFLPSFIRMGLLPDCGVSWLLPRLIGEGPALQMLLAGRPVDAQRARELGLVSQVSSDPLQAALDLAATLTRHPEAAVATKRLLRTTATVDLATAIDFEAVAQAAAFQRGEFASSFDSWRTKRIAD
ncbi:enoyl-CoA hydratase/isomerase family protein [Nocardia sp. NPDC020380]|uniref:enoyl-CoA hydratase/isomerase family protein n=1 Tax=Nocardia sp. NPDC020380 TaxID=3364309 RepID=UPI00379D2679